MLFEVYDNRDASDVVLEGWAQQQQYTNTTFTTSLRFLDKIVDISQGIGNAPLADTTMGDVTAQVSAFEKPDNPTLLDITADFPSFDETLNLVAVSPLEMPDEPTLTAAAPDFTDYDAPTAFSGTAPTAPVIAEQSYPDAPSESLPTAPSLRDLLLPSAPEVASIEFTSTLPGTLEAAPNATFAFSESDYASSLLSAIQSKLQTLVAGMTTGLDPAVEQQIWDRARRRTAITARRLKAQNERYWSASGWDIPGGDLRNKQYEAEQEAVNLDVAESRSIAIAQADLEQKNFQFALNTAVQIEGILIQHFDAQQQRALEAAKYVVESAIQLYGLRVTEYNAKIEAYKADATVYTARIQAELSKVELYKAQLEGQKLIGELNQQDIAIYREQINAVLAIYELYKAKLEAVKTRLSGDQLRLQSFESEIKAFESLIRAKSLEYDQFKILNDAQLTKAEIFKARVGAYSSQVDAFKGIVEARKAQQEADIEINQRVPLEVYKQKAEALRTLVQAESGRIDAVAKYNQTAAAVFESQTKAETARVEGEVAVQEQEIKYLIADSTAKIETVKANISSYLAQTEMLMEAAKAGAQVAAQLAAASLSAVNLSASINEGISTSTSESSSVSSSTTRIISD